MGRPKLPDNEVKRRASIRISGIQKGLLVFRYGSIQKWLDLALWDEEFRGEPLKPRKRRPKNWTDTPI